MANASSSLPDSSVLLTHSTVVDCVLRVYDQLNFPKPETGVVRVFYPVSFSLGQKKAGKSGAGAVPEGKVARIRAGAISVSGRLSKEVIQRILRQNHGLLRRCYEKGLSEDPNLQGRIAVRFVINSNGSVGSAANASSSLPDSSVLLTDSWFFDCVVRTLDRINFPKPETGVVRVFYPVSFSLGQKKFR